MRTLLLASALLWLAATVAGFIYLTRFKNTAADTSVVYPVAFPPTSSLKPDPELPTIIFFAHPKCPCTRASLRELAKLTADINGKARTYVVFIKPKEEEDDWASTDLRTMAEAIPGVQVVIDRDEVETKIFNARTSSLTLLYDRTGQLRFDGGITAARGHEGDNAGRSAIFEIVTSDAERTAETLVFGCPLFQKDCPGELIPAAE
jgi:hypothetical protein